MTDNVIPFRQTRKHENSTETISDIFVASSFLRFGGLEVIYFAEDDEKYKIVNAQEFVDSNKNISPYTALAQIIHTHKEVGNILDLYQTPAMRESNYPVRVFDLPNDDLETTNSYNRRFSFTNELVITKDAETGFNVLTQYAFWAMRDISFLGLGALTKPDLGLNSYQDYEFLVDERNIKANDFDLEQLQNLRLVYGYFLKKLQGIIIEVHHDFLNKESATSKIPVKPEELHEKLTVVSGSADVLPESKDTRVSATYGRDKFLRDMHKISNLIDSITKKFGEIPDESKVIELITADLTYYRNELTEYQKSHQKPQPRLRLVHSWNNQKPIV